VKKAQFLGVLFLLLITLAIGAAAQTGVVTTTSTITASASIFDPCSGEYVDYSGSVQLIVNTWTDANGATHVRTKVPTQNVTGVGESTHGNYIVQTNGNSVEMTAADRLPLEITSVARFALIGTGTVPNEHTLMVFHQTVNPDGTTTTEVDQMVDKCN